MRPSPISLQKRSYLDAYLALCPGDRAPLWLNFPPTLSSQAGILKAGAAGVELPLKAKHALAQVMMGPASAQRFPFLDKLSKTHS